MGLFKRSDPAAYDRLIEADRALMRNTAKDIREGVTRETPEFLRANRAVADAEADCTRSQRRRADRETQGEWERHGAI